jgi:hypothetical protein
MTKSKRTDEYNNLIFRAKDKAYNRVLVGVPMTGLLRSEWHLAKSGQIIPCNWSHTDIIQWLRPCTPIGYDVANARNIVAHEAVQKNFEWLFFIDHDVLLPQDCYIKINQYMLSGKYPVVSGLYFAKAHPPEPLIYRGRGNGHYTKWKMGDTVMVDGIPMGCALINVKLLKEMAKDAEDYTVDSLSHGKITIKKVFDTPFGRYEDPETKGWHSYSGTEDLAWCNRVMEGKYLAKAGWPELQKEKYPFVMDTSIFCRHITNDGQIYPIGIG